MTVKFDESDNVTILTTVSDVDDVDALVRSIDDAEADLLELADTGEINPYARLSFAFEKPDGWRLDHSSFFEHAFAFGPVRERAAAFLETYLDWIEDTSGLYDFWKDAENPTLHWVAYLLAMAEEQYIPLYIRFIEHTDMDHEVPQRGQIDDLIDEHGWTDGIETLLAVRGTTAMGQFGFEQLRDQATFIREHASSPLHESSLFDAFLAYYHTYPDRAMSYLAEDHGKMLLDEDEQEAWMDRVERELDS